MHRSFVWYEFRGKDPRAAGDFYAAVLGLHFAASGDGGLLVDGDEAVLGIARLPAPAAARGVPAHWLAHVGVGASDLAAECNRFSGLGATMLVTNLVAADGSTYAVMRDPLGSVVALSSRTQSPARPAVAWHHLHATDSARAFAAYSEMFGWVARGESAPGGGVDHAATTFAFDAASAPVGSFANTALNPGVHTHWSICFRVPDLVRTREIIVGRGGEVFMETVLPTGDPIAACHDPQGAEFSVISQANP